ncbi:MAG TPA: hypothetical protein VMA13_12035 [Candidatus Saccharimonadales bacterium]|nr:hypothetical protein [Candidatus Saccharimonadales bacterium]
MKQYASTALALVCIVLIASLIMMKQSDDKQHGDDAAAIADFSNQLWSAQTQLAIREGTILTLSNSLDTCLSASLTLSNRLTDAESTLALDTEQITSLNQRVADLESENQTLQTTLDQRVTDLTNQVAGLTQQIALTETNLHQANKNYVLLENRFRRDVAERVVVEQKFNNLSDLKAQIRSLKENPAQEISAQSIYEGLDVEVNSNGSFHVLAPN